MEAVAAAQQVHFIAQQTGDKVKIPVYRVFDDSKAKQDGRSWTIEDPTKMKDWRDRLAVYPAWNDGTKVVKGYVTVTDMAEGRVVPGPGPGSTAGPQPADPGLGGGPYRGGGNELRIPDASSTVRGQTVSPFDGQ